jgi:hypothetical protein
VVSRHVVGDDSEERRQRVGAGVHIYFLIGFANRLFVLLQWGLDFLTKRRRVRVLSEEPPSAENLIDPAA